MLTGRRLAYGGLLAVAALASAPVAPALAGPAAASPAATAPVGPVLGSLAITPAKGYDNDTLSFTTSGVCPKPATNLLVSLSGKGIATDRAGLVENSSESIYLDPSGTATYDVPAASTLEELADEQQPPVNLSGSYTVVLKCIRAAGLADYGTYVGHFTMSGRQYTAHNVAVPSAAPSAPGSAVSGAPAGSTAPAPQTSAAAGGTAPSASAAGAGVNGSAADGSSSTSTASGAPASSAAPAAGSAGPSAATDAGALPGAQQATAAKSTSSSSGVIIAVVVVVLVLLAAGALVVLRRRSSSRVTP